jgi:FkbM family methyltransferase
MAEVSLRARLLADRRVLRAAQTVRAGLVRITTPTPELREWRRIDGDHTLRLQYDLGPESTVLDVGGFEGQFASDIVAMYGCRVEVFEPVPAFAEKIAQRFARNPLVTVHACGLSSGNGTVTLDLSGDASSHARGPAEHAVTGELRAVEDVFAELGDRSLDLMKINIEGAEYDLLEHMVATGLIERVRDIQVQFHLFVPDASQRMHALRAALGRTHVPTYQYDFMWENWRRR